MINKLYSNNQGQLPRFPIIMLGLTVLITVITLSWLGFHNYETNRVLKTAETVHVNAVKLHGRILHLNELLMMSVQMAVATGDKKWEDRYEYYRPILVNTINQAVKLSGDRDVHKTADITDNANLQLMTMEQTALELAKKGNLAEAQKIINSHSYESQMNAFKNGMTNYQDQLEQQAQLNLDNQLNKMYYSIIVIISDFILLIAAWAVTFRSIFIWKKELEQIIISQMEYKKEVANARHFLHEMLLINKMNDTLQSCQQLQEAYPIINLTAEELFPNLSGGLSIRRHSNEMETVEQWGKFKLLKSFYMIYDCWGLRDGNVYIVNDPKKTLPCRHFESIVAGYICIPLILQDGILGLLELNATPGNSITDYQQQLAITFSEVIKLSLGNIKLREKLNAEAIHDPLTGLFNRCYLDEVLPRALQHALLTKNKLCIVMLDIDNFKLINDTKGHEAGDETLRYLGKALREHLLSSDIICRYGGEEFVIILLDTNLDKAVLRLTKLSKIISSTALYAQSQLLSNITVSMGVAEAPTHGRTVESLISLADEALYRAKMAGKNRIELAKTKSE